MATMLTLQAIARLTHNGKKDGTLMGYLLASEVLAPAAIQPIDRPPVAYSLNSILDLLTDHIILCESTMKNGEPARLIAVGKGKKLTIKTHPDDDLTNNLDDLETRPWTETI